jgi:hypothetical protein
LQAKVVLVDRDIEKWEQSFQSIINYFYTKQAFVLKNCIEPFFSNRPAALLQKVLYHLFDCSSKETWKQNCRRGYLAHYANVRSLCPPDRLLEYRLGSGWEPLCEFLGKPVPRGVPFPHLNEHVEFEKRLVMLQNRELRKGLLALASRSWWIGVLAGGGLYCAWNFMLHAWPVTGS